MIAAATWSQNPILNADGEGFFTRFDLKKLGLDARITSAKQYELEELKFGFRSLVTRPWFVKPESDKPCKLLNAEEAWKGVKRLETLMKDPLMTKSICRALAATMPNLNRSAYDEDDPLHFQSWLVDQVMKKMEFLHDGVSLEQDLALKLEEKFTIKLAASADDFSAENIAATTKLLQKIARNFPDEFTRLIFTKAAIANIQGLDEHQQATIGEQVKQIIKSAERKHNITLKTPLPVKEEQQEAIIDTHEEPEEEIQHEVPDNSKRDSDDDNLNQQSPNTSAGAWDEILVADDQTQTMTSNVKTPDKEKGLTKDSAANNTAASDKQHKRQSSGSVALYDELSLGQQINLNQKYGEYGKGKDWELTAYASRAEGIPQAVEYKDGEKHSAESLTSAVFETPTPKEQKTKRLFLFRGEEMSKALKEKIHSGGKHPQDWKESINVATERKLAQEEKGEQKRKSLVNS